MVSSQTGLREEYEIKALEEKRVKSREKRERRFEETEALIKSFGMSPDEKRKFIIELSKRIGVIYWERTEIVKKIKHSDVLELAGPTARGMGHGLCIYNNNAIDTFDILFIETDEEKLKELEKSIKRE